MSTLQDLPAVLASPVRLDLHLVPDALPDTLPEVEDREFEALLRAAVPRLQRYAASRLGDHHEAEELTQEALLRAYEHRHVLRTADDVMAWTTVVVGRLVIDRLRVRGRSISVAEVPEGRRRSPDTARVVIARAEARLALDALSSLPGRQAAVLWAREVEGLRYDEIAERHGLSEGSVRSLLLRARRGLRREYTLRGGTAPVGGLLVLAPWLSPLRSLGRLRRVLTSGAGATVGAAAVVAALTLPHQGGGVTRTPDARATVSTAHVRVMPVAQPPRAKVRQRPPARVVAVLRAVAPAAAHPKVTAAPDRVRQLRGLGSSALGPRFCRGGASVAAGVNCVAPDHTQDLVLVLPDTVGSALPVVEPHVNLGVNCKGLSIAPLTRCRAEQGTTP
jgi:RNA polymerase sigma factor (sigma-70 family)